MNYPRYNFRGWLAVTLAFFCLSGTDMPHGATGRHPEASARASSRIYRGPRAFFAADDPAIGYMGRVDFSNPKLPRWWAPGVTVRARFKGADCLVLLRDEVLWGNSHNYIEVVVDDQPPYRIQTKGQQDTIVVKGSPGVAVHSFTICKDTESGIGYLGLEGLLCEGLLPLPHPPSRKIECIGNSITCGTGMDLSVIPCDKGQWYDQHNAWMSYGPVTARALGAQWHLSAVSGIGLIHSCCKMTVTMPEVFDKINMRADTLAWDFSRYQPDVVTICLGQNDGIQDSVVFCRAYVDFIRKIRGYYPRAQIVCLTSPMADAALTAVLKHNLSGILTAVRQAGDARVHTYFYSRQYSHGCGGHPDLAEHQLIAGELTAYLKRLMEW